MIERYALHTIDTLRDHFGLTDGVPKGTRVHYNISPTQLVPVVLRRDGATVMEHMHWGFVPQNSKDMNSVFRYKTFNVRSEDVFKKTSWDTAVRSRRCVVPANGFYVWQKSVDGKQPFYVQAKTASVMAMAGMYGQWTMPDGTTHGMMTLLTVPRTAELSGYTDCSPVLLESRERIAAWLDPARSDATDLYDAMRTPQSDTFLIHAVSDMVNSAKCDDARMITPQK